MKISPVAAPSGQPGQALGSAEVGRTADPVKMERARAIARGELAPEVRDPQAERILNTRRIKMRTNHSSNREEFQPETAPEEVEAPQSSTPDATETATVEATQPLSPQFAALAKQKRALQLEKAEFEKQKAELAGGGNTQELIASLKSNPLGVLLEHGVTYDQLTEAILNGQQGNPEIQALKQEIRALKEGVDKSFQTREEQQEESALTEMLYEAEELAKEGDAFELIRERNAYDQVLRKIHSTYKKTGRVLDVSTAMDIIETQLLSEAEKLAGLNKVRSKFAPPPAPLQPQQRSGMRTLTARDSSAAPLSARARAIAAFQGTLKR